MMQYNLALLDNPVWHALQTTHQKFAIGTPVIQRYPAHILPFIGYEKSAVNPLNDILPWITANEKVFIVGDLPALPVSWSVLANLDCAQMICPELPTAPVKNTMEILSLSQEDNEEMFALINLVQPGFFKRGTPLLGNYYGIKVQGKLIAMAGQRLGMQGFTEISAVCTHPDFTGKGFAQQLVLHLCKNIHAQGTIPILHVLNTNKRAVGLYELLGFTKRRDIPFWQIIYTGKP
ncbi:FR47-like protein [Chitinophaga niastensis]|uniref:FR47-like protein n=1 Tax=Chitinophaga niastensis TaxID=536980 RepID=A0A2P8HD91_CHINA|nr:GNAT family N-acetyltransferase [Chitinophaga niastensis]PSL44187.1 FR47-like protein [Chitinophaga niastensis]